MARVRRSVEVKEKNFWALFDGGARNTYVIEEVASLLPTFPLEKPEWVALGGKIHKVEKDCRLACLVEGFPIRVNARVLPEIGNDEKDKRIEVLIGALAMEEWGITPIPHEDRLDMTHYPKEFTEFSGFIETSDELNAFSGILEKAKQVRSQRTGEYESIKRDLEATLGKLQEILQRESRKETGGSGCSI